MKNKLYLVRHGENPANLLGMLSSRKVDFSLTDKGRLQAAQTAEVFRGLRLDAVYASPLKRAVETARIIAAPHGLEVGVMENFREIYPGLYEDRPDSEESWRAWYTYCGAWKNGQPELAFPGGGENYFMVRDRMRAGLEAVLDGRPDRTVLIVTHVGFMMETIGDVCPAVDTAELFRQETQNCAITEVDMTRVDSRWVGELVRWSDFTHLHGEAAKFIPGLVKFE